VTAHEDALREGRWSFDVAWDGHRVLGARVGDHVRLVSADLREWSERRGKASRLGRRIREASVPLERSSMNLVKRVPVVLGIAGVGN
jgi:ATP-dependent DNA ligase